MVYENDVLILRKPTIDDAQKVWDFRQEFIDNDEVMCGDSGMKKYENYVDWLDKVSKDDNPEFLQVGRVLATQFIAIRKSDNIVVGAVNVRHSLTDNLRIHGGHIGDCIRKSERGKGYGTMQIGLALQFCKDIGVDRALMSCVKTNIASERSIVKNGGILENEVFADGEVYKRFWINLQ